MSVVSAAHNRVTLYREGSKFPCV
ncbi:hypothetical protein N5I72_04030 [Klebsiella variicola]|nr:MULTISPECIES: hypothetical protein [Klebsiella]MCF1310392.1 hypothetical protein [Klebsiella quasipneumoniae]MCW9403294.1 hypothetical protein [Klebsiella variicola]UPS75282.1 hypothetical protein M0M92_19160 [Klebsiella quasipneumoniae]